MAGHSKWANIKHKKDRADKKKGKIFSRVAKEIISAVKLGGPDPKANTRLRLALQKAKAANVPQENIDRNIKKASSQDQADYTELTYELYGHGGVGIIAEVMTDNKNRTASEMRIATNKCGGSVASPGSVSFNFERKGVIRVTKEHADEEDLFSLATSAGAEDFETDDLQFTILTHPQELYTVKEAIEKGGVVCDEAGLEMIPNSLIDCELENAKSNFKLLEYLEELEDVDAVYHNMEVSDEVAGQLAS